MRKICVIGGAGLVGANVAHALYEKGISVTVVDNLQFGFKDNLPPCDFIEDDFVNMSEEFWNSFDVIVVSYCSNIIFAMSHVIETIENNAIKFKTFLDRYHGKIIYLSTSSVYGTADVFPTPETAEIKTSNAYDTSKRIAELFLQQRGNYTSLRLSNVYGKYQRPENPYCGVLGRMIDSAINDKPIEIYGDGTATRDYTHVSDVVKAILLAIDQPPKNAEINIATGIETSVNDLCKMVWKAVDKPVKYNRTQLRSIDATTRRCLDIKKAEQLLGWKPAVTLEDGIMQTINILVSA